MKALQTTLTSGRLARIVRWIARILSLPAVGIMLLFLFGEWDMSSVAEITPAEWIGLALFPTGVLLGLLVAWRKEALGSWISIGALVIFYAYDFLLGGDVPDGPFFLLFASPAILFALSAFLNPRAENQLEPKRHIDT